MWKGNKLTNDAIPEMFAYHGAHMANTLKCPLVVFSRAGNMARFLSHYRPNKPIFAFTESQEVQQNLSLYYGVYCSQMKFERDQDPTFEKVRNSEFGCFFFSSCSLNSSFFLFFFQFTF